MNTRHFALLLIISFLWSTAFAQSSRKAPPKRELRGVWVTTAFNLDFPDKPTTWPVAHQEQWRKLLAQYKSLGFNTIFFQVRPAGDAFYPSELAPWSAYLTGRQDLPPKPEYDPLEFMIQEAHQQGMEFHAWFNPFRATMNLDTAELSLRHVFKRHRRWVKQYGRRFYMDPGVPEAREHIRDVVMEVVDQYDVDGVHFDDYFYPYPIAGQPFPDTMTYLQHGRSSYQDIGDWRRDNVNKMVQMVSEAIRESKPHVFFGISPFGVWRNQEDDQQGSDTKASITSYDDVYADAKTWLRKDWIDYIVPQLYWHIGFEPADHQKLQRWWGDNKAGKQLYIGHAAYKVANDKQEQWYEPNQIARQIRLARRNRRIDGSAFFRSGSVLADPLNLKDTLRAYYGRPALIPEREGLSVRTYQAPDLRKVKNEGGDACVLWRPNKANRDKKPRYYVVYRFPGAGIGNTEDPRNIIKVTGMGADEKKLHLLDTKVEEGQVYTYMVTAVNRAHLESQASAPITITRDNGRIKKYTRPKRKKRRRKSRD